MMQPQVSLLVQLAPTEVLFPSMVAPIVILNIGSTWDMLDMSPQLLPTFLYAELPSMSRHSLHVLVIFPLLD